MTYLTVLPEKKLIYPNTLPFIMEYGIYYSTLYPANKVCFVFDFVMYLLYKGYLYVLLNFTNFCDLNKLV